LSIYNEAFEDLNATAYPDRVCRRQGQLKKNCNYKALSLRGEIEEAGALEVFTKGRAQWGVSYQGNCKQ